VSTRVGYAGGTTENPEYSNLGDHSETVQITYDPAQISYEELLDVFWYIHNPTVKPLSDQYKSVIFYHDDEQKRLAMETKERREAEVGSTIYTEIVPAAEFYLAEAYHQKYHLRQIPELAGEFMAIYPDIEDFVNSAAVTRINGYAAGYGAEDVLQEELYDLGLSPEGIERVLNMSSGLAPVYPFP
jgi:peptide-methionine (S)-S-oxide reductase